MEQLFINKPFLAQPYLLSLSYRSIEGMCWEKAITPEDV